MKRFSPPPLLIPSLMLFGLLAISGCSNAESATDISEDMQVEDIQIVNREDKKRIDVYIDQTHFTSYLFSEEGSSLKKPILYPLKTASGINITRGWPFDKKAGERVDHPHHTGHWLNYGDVNGLDFWNHSEQTPEERLPKMGSIVHRSVKKTYNGSDSAGFEVEMDWLRPDGSTILKEETHFIFQKDDNLRIVDRITKLTADDGPVDFTDNKEGMIAIRVTRALEHIDPKPVLLSDEHGEPLAQKVISNEGVTGMYLSESGIAGTDVWGTRSPWMILSGTVEQEQVSVAIIDHPKNPGYPTYWHARGYGLFAANPLGQKALSDGEDVLNFHLDKDQSATFRYRMAILTTPTNIRAEVVSLATAFAATE